MTSIPKQFIGAALLLGGILSAIAQTPDESASREHFFPLIADGGGFQSYLFVTNVSDAANQCTLALQGPDLDTGIFKANDSLAPAGASATIELAAGVGVTLESTGESALTFGYAKLDCDQPAVARMLLTLENSGDTLAITVLESANPGTSFQFPVLPGSGQLFMILSSAENLDAACSVELEDDAGTSIGAGNVTVPANSTALQILDELIPIPNDLDAGTARLSCNQNIASLGLLRNGSVFTALPAIDLENNAKPSNTLPLILDGDGFRSQLLLTNLAETSNQCSINLRGAGLDASQFDTPDGATATLSSVTLELGAKGDQASLLSPGANELSFGYATIECDEPAAALNLLTVSAAGSLAGMAAVSGAQPANGFRFPVVPNLARMALVLNNVAESDASCTVELSGIGDTTAPMGLIEIPGQSSAVRFLGDLLDVPDDFPGGTTRLSCDGDVSAISLPLSGAVFAAMPPVIISTTESSNISPIFVDANLRLAIERALGKTSGAPITQAEMSTLTELNAPGADISDLSGLEYATNLTYLNLQYNYGIKDISALSSLINLETFTLGCNRFTDLSPLAGLTKLKDLSIGGNGFTGISSLSGLTSLTRLHAGNNNVTDLSPLSGMINLTVLDLKGNELADTSPLAGLTNLERLELLRNNITDISPLSGLTQLGYLDLRHNAITDISPLSGLSKLRSLWLRNNDIAIIPPLLVTNYLGLADNEISDISGLSGATSVRRLDLGGNEIMNIAPLSDLLQLDTLRLGFNNITDTSPLTELTNLTLLDLKFNNIMDISSLLSLTGATALDLRGNPLSDSSIGDQVAALRSSGVRVLIDSSSKGDFDIELVFLDDVPDYQKNVIQSAARRWMSVIVGDLPDYAFAQEFSGMCGGQPYEIPSGERIDDLRIYVSTSVSSTFALAHGSPHVLRENTQLPVVGCMALRLDAPSFAFILGLHEIGHVLGFGTLWNKFGFLHDLSFSDSSADTHFNGPLAIAAFDDTGGRDYEGKKVPVEQRDGEHWRINELWGDIMLPAQFGEMALSAITVQSLADLGYVVDVTEADDYAVFGARTSVAAVQSLIPSSSLSGRPENTDWIRSRDFDFDSGESGLMEHPVTLSQAESDLFCAADFGREPIHVIDRQGYIIGTID